MLYSSGLPSSSVVRIVASPSCISSLKAISIPAEYFSNVFIVPLTVPKIPKFVFLFTFPIDVCFDILPFISPGNPFCPFVILNIF